MITLTPKVKVVESPDKTYFSIVDNSSTVTSDGWQDDQFTINLNNPAKSNVTGIVMIFTIDGTVYTKTLNAGEIESFLYDKDGIVIHASNFTLSTYGHGVVDLQIVFTGSVIGESDAMEWSCNNDLCFALFGDIVEGYKSACIAIEMPIKEDANQVNQVLNLSIVKELFDIAEWAGNYNQRERLSDILNYIVELSSNDFDVQSSLNY